MGLGFLALVLGALALGFSVGLLRGRGKPLRWRLNNALAGALLGGTVLTFVGQTGLATLLYIQLFCYGGGAWREPTETAQVGLGLMYAMVALALPWVFAPKERFPEG